MTENPKPDENRRWLDEPANITRLWYALIGLCVISVICDFFYHKHAEFDVENIPGMYGWWALIACGIMFFGAKLLRMITMRPEDYYDKDDD